MRKPVVVAISIALLLPAGAGAGTGIVGKCSLSGGSMASPSEVDAMQRGIINEIREVTYALNSGQTQQIKAQQNLLNEISQAQAAHQKTLAAAQARSQYLNETLGPQSQPAGACETPGEARARAQGEAVSSMLAHHFEAEAAEHNRGGTSRREAMQAAAEHPADTQALYSGEGGADAAAAVVNGLTVPIPPLAYQPGEDTEPPPAGTRHIAEHRAWSARVQVAQSALALIAARHTPTLDAAPAKAAWEGGGNDGPAPGLSPDGEYISQAGEMDVQVARYRDDPNWQAQLAASNRTGVLRHLNQAGVLSAHQSLVSLETLQHLAAVTAVEYARRIDKGGNEGISTAAQEAQAR